MFWVWCSVHCTFSMWLHSWCSVDCVSKQAISRHFEAHNTSHTWPWEDTNGTCYFKAVMHGPLQLHDTATLNGNFTGMRSEAELVMLWLRLMLHHLPVCRPILSLSVSFGRCLILNLLMEFSNSRETRAISRACSWPLRMGSPETSMYASPMVST